MSDENKQENENQQPPVDTQSDTKPKQTSALNDPSPSSEIEESVDTETVDKPKPTSSLSDAPLPEAEVKAPEKDTVKFDDAQKKSRQTNTFDPTKETAILSRDNPLLRRALNHQSDDDENQLQGTTTLGEKREVILLIRGMAERVVMQEGIIYKLGRFELGLSAPDEIDLTPYGAMDRGVSRVHAQLHLENDRLYITDLSSTNGTYVSGNKVEPNTPTALRKGDELLLGRLQVQILFR